MSSPGKVTTRFPVESDFTGDRVRRVSDLINEAYDEAEAGMWKRKGTRTDPASVERLLRDRALILAEMDGALVGSVNVSLMGEGVGEFGMLVADSALRGAGIGTALVGHAETWAREAGCRTMRLELLTPRHWTNPSKEFLKAWYTRIGYSPQATESLESMHPNLVPKLATECDFTVWHKSLT
jgi:GNAT superfamily N-acetyltransferase